MLKLVPLIAALALGVQSDPCAELIPLACEKYESSNLLDKLQCLVANDYKIGKICTKSALSPLFTQTYSDSCSSSLLASKCLKNKDGKFPDDADEVGEFLDCFAEESSKTAPSSVNKDCLVDKDVLEHHHHHHHPCPHPGPPGPPDHHHHDHHHDDHHHHDHHHHGHDEDEKDGKKDDMDDDDDDDEDEDDKPFVKRPAPWKMWDRFHSKNNQQPPPPGNRDQQAPPNMMMMAEQQQQPTDDHAKMHEYFDQAKDDPNAISFWDFFKAVASYQETGVRPNCKLPWEDSVELPVCVFRPPRHHHKIIKAIVGILLSIFMVKMVLRYRRGKCCKKSSCCPEKATPLVVAEEDTTGSPILAQQYQPLKEDTENKV